MGDTLNNPFDMTQPNTGQPGMLGQTPDFWRSIALMGGNMAAGANARTADGFLANGPGLAGPLGAAVGQTMQQTGQGAVQRSAIAGQNAETQGRQIANVGAAAQLPLTLAKTQMLTNFYTHPEMLQQMFGTFSGGGSAPAAASPSAPNGGAGSSYAQTVNAMEGNTPSTTSHADGYGQFEPATWQQFQNENPQYFQGMTPDQALAARRDPGLGAKATDWLASKNGPVLAQNGVQPNGATLAMSHFLGPTATAAVIKAPDDAIVGGVVGQALGPEKGAQYIQANPSLATTTVGALKARYANVPDPGAAASQGGGNAGVGQEALVRAQQYEQQANMIELAHSMGLPVAGDPAALRAAAQQWRGLGLAGPEAAQKAANSNVEMRPGGMSGLIAQDGTRTWVKNPQLEQVQNPDGSFTYTHVTPPLPGSPPNTPGESTPVMDASGRPVVSKLAPNLQAARTKAYEDFAGKDTDSYIAAQNVGQWLEQMNHAADTLNANKGFMGTGPTAPARLEFANNVNDILRTAGLPAAFDPTQVSSFEELKKATTTAGFELASHYEGHARQAAQTIMNAVSAVPSVQNSPVGFHVVSAGIQEAAQAAIDLHQAKQETYNQGGDLSQTETDFFKRNPEQMYARRAISTVTPYNIKSDAELSRYLPGTFVRYKGNVVQVPERDGAPPVPEYLKPAPQQTAQQ